MKRNINKFYSLLLAVCLLFTGIIPALAEGESAGTQPDHAAAYAEAVALFTAGDYAGTKAGFDALRGTGVLESWAEQFIFETDWEAARGFFADGDYAAAAERLFHIENDTGAVDWLTLPGIWDALILTAEKMNESGDAQGAADLLFTIKAHIDMVSGTDGIAVRDALIGSAEYSEANGHRTVAVETLFRLFDELSAMGRDTSSTVDSLLIVADNMRADNDTDGAVELLFRLYTAQTAAGESAAEAEADLLSAIAHYTSTGAYGTAYTQLYRLRDALETAGKQAGATYTAIVVNACAQAASGAHRDAVTALLNLESQQQDRGISVEKTANGIVRCCESAAKAGDYAYAFEQAFAARELIVSAKAKTADADAILLGIAAKAADAGERTLAMESLFKLRALSTDYAAIDEKIVYVANTMSHAKEYAPAKTALIAINDWENMRAVVKAEQADQKAAADKQTFEQAEQLLVEGKPDEAKELFLSLGDYAGAAERAATCTEEAERLRAEKLFEAGSYTEAKAVFKKLGSYENAAARVTDCEKGERYLLAKENLTNGNYEAAMEGFLTTEGFRDTAELLTSAKEGVYNTAVSLAGANEPAEAARLFDLVPDIADSKTKAAALRNEKTALKSAKKGDVVLMGQSASKQDIEWIVLDKTDTALLLLSRYGWESATYFKKEQNTTWEKSAVRASFKEITCFTKDEQAMILKTKVKTPKNEAYKVNGGNNTNDTLFLLSIDEVNTYFATDEARKIQTPAEHAYGSAGDWWLRSPGQKGSYAAVVTDEGKVDTAGKLVTQKALVRPAMWVSIGN